MTKVTIPASDEAWDDETLGADPEFMKEVDQSVVDRVNESSGTQLVSIRMQKSMVEAFKVIAGANKGIGYQTLMKQILQRFIDCETKRVWNEHLHDLKEAQRSAEAAEKTREKRKAA